MACSAPHPRLRPDRLHPVGKGWTLFEASLTYNRGMPATATTNQVQRIRDLLEQLEWTESDAWILVSELPDSFPATLDQNTPALSSMPGYESAVLIQRLEELLSEEEKAGS